MRQIEVSYDNMKNKMIAELSKLGSEGLYLRGILATASDNIVTARRMRLVPNGLTIYCWTNPHTRKLSQISINPNVAVVAGFIQIEGIAELKGHPKNDIEFLEAYKISQPDNYRNHTSKNSNWHTMDRILIKITPKRVALSTIMKKGSSVESQINILNVVEGKAYEIQDFDNIQANLSDAPAYSE